jgi:Glycosyl hydrolases family 35
VTFRACELHYFRVPRDLWELYLLRAGQLGVDTISTYIPWFWHEPEPGTFDLSGATDERRDLQGFVDLIQGYGYGFIAKPGPFIDAETIGGGVPPWLFRDHPEIVAKRFNGDPFRHWDSHEVRATYRHPAYVEAVGRWFDAVTPILRAVQDRGGLTAVQVDNECPGDGMWSYEMDPPSPNRADFNEPWTDRMFSMPRAWPSPPPSSLEELEPFVELERYADEQMTGGVAIFAQQLRERGIVAPLFHDMNCGRWEISPMLCDMGKLSRAVGGWLGSNVYAEDVRDEFVATGEYRYSFEEYVHFGHWRPRLMRSYAPEHPVFSPEIASVGDVYLHAPMMGGTEAWCIYMLHQVPDDPPDVGAYPSWAMEAPMTREGEPTEHFWDAKTLFTYLGAVMPGMRSASLPADVVLTYDRTPELAASWAEIDGAGWPEGDPFGAEVRSMNHGRRSQELAQELVRRQVEFDVVDVRYAEEGWASRYRHVLEPGDRVPDDPGLRHAWTDAEGVDVTPRFGVGGDIYLTFLNRTQERREGTATWRGGGEITFAMDGPKLCAAHLSASGEVRSAILGGRASLGAVWFTGRLGAVASIGDTLVLTASTEGVFHVPVRGRQVHRLTWNGALHPWEAEGDLVQYVEVDGDGRTDCLFVGDPVEAYLERFRRFAGLMAERLGPEIMADPQEAWERAQAAMAEARVRGDLEAAAPHERVVRLLNLLASVHGELG